MTLYEQCKRDVLSVENYCYKIIIFCIQFVCSFKIKKFVSNKNSNVYSLKAKNSINGKDKFYLLALTAT